MPVVDFCLFGSRIYAGLEVPEDCTVDRWKCFVALGGLGGDAPPVEGLAWQRPGAGERRLRGRDLLPTRPRPVVVDGPKSAVEVLARALQKRLGPPVAISPELILKDRFLACASSDCKFLVNSSPSRGGYCCILCYVGQGHGPYCERVLAPPGLERAPFELLPPGESQAKYARNSLTMGDLRNDDGAWRPPRDSEKARLSAVIASTGSISVKGPYLDYAGLKRGGGVPSLVPSLRPDEFAWSLDFDPNFVCELLYEGAYTIAVEIPQEDPSILPVQILLIAWDQRISVWDFQETHISRQVRKRAKHYTLTADRAFDEVLLGCMREHGENWLFRGWRWMIRKLFREGYTGDRSIRVSVHSFELWGGGSELVAGDIGCCVGGVYCSMAGFHRQHTRNCGEIQLVLAAAALHRMGFSWVDLGQVLRYKSHVGSRVLQRDEYLRRFRRDRDEQVSFGMRDGLSSEDLLNHMYQVVADAPRREEPADPALAGQKSEGRQPSSPPDMPNTSPAEMQIWLQTANCDVTQV